VAVAAAAAAVDEGDSVMNGSSLKLALCLGLAGHAAIADPRTFVSPEEAVTDLVAALAAADREAVLSIFGPENLDVVSTGDAAEDKEIWGDFLEGAEELTRIDMVSPDMATLYVGRDLWPFPAPLVRDGTGWTFDAAAAREEVLMRRIGRHELAAIDLLKRANAVQMTYRRTDHDGDGVMEFAAGILSTPGQRDGLYWPASAGGLSPFDDRIARANLEGFAIDGQDVEPDPWEGYYFKILQEQGPSAPGGAYSYLVNGNMVSGYAVLAVPAIYGDTGIMTFMVGENGIVYEADLGDETLDRALQITSFDPGEGWEVVE
jgi:hypothetical protein